MRASVCLWPPRTRNSQCSEGSWQARGTCSTLQAPKTKAHLLWDYPHLQAHEARWFPLLLVEAAPLPTQALPSAWTACLRATGLPLVAPINPLELDEACRLMFCLYGMYLVVLSACMEAEVVAHRDTGVGPLVFVVACRHPPDASPPALSVVATWRWVAAQGTAGATSCAPHWEAARMAMGANLHGGHPAIGRSRATARQVHEAALVFGGPCG